MKYKTTSISLILTLFIAIGLFSCTSNYSFVNSNHKIRTYNSIIFDFKITPKKQDRSSYNNALFYYSFYNGKIVKTIGSSVGELLHGDFSKTTPDGQLIEEGQFNMGLKNGPWKFWTPQGKLVRVESWKDGFLQQKRQLQNDNIHLHETYKNKSTVVQEIKTDSLIIQNTIKNGVTIKSDTTVVGK